MGRLLSLPSEGAFPTPPKINYFPRERPGKKYTRLSFVFNPPARLKSVSFNLFSVVYSRFFIEIFSPLVKEVRGYLSPSFSYEYLENCCEEIFP